MTGRSLPRRSVLALGLAAAAGWALPGQAGAADVRVGQLSFTVPGDMVATTGDTTLGQGWQWQGRDSGPTRRPATVLLVRADLVSTDAEEIAGLVLAGSLAGRLPALQLGDRRTRSMPGGGDQTRYELTYTPSRGLSYHGTMLVATRPGPTSGLLVMLGDEGLTAGALEVVLDSARWQP